MKDLKVKILWVLLNALFIAALSNFYSTEAKNINDGNFAKFKTVLFKLDGMSCSEDAEIIQNKIKELDGIKECKVSFVKKQIKVKYDDTKVTKEKLVEFIEALPDCDGKGTFPYKLREI